MTGIDETKYIESPKSSVVELLERTPANLGFYFGNEYLRSSQGSKGPRVNGNVNLQKRLTESAHYVCSIHKGSVICCHYNSQGQSAVGDTLQEYGHSLPLRAKCSEHPRTAQKFSRAALIIFGFGDSLRSSPQQLICSHMILL